MAWPAELPAVCYPPKRFHYPTKRTDYPRGTQVIGPFKKHYQEHRTLYRIFNDATYRVYYETSIPGEGDSPTATSATVAYDTPALEDGTYYCSMSRFNGVLDSGFYPIGAQLQTYLKVVIANGADAGLPPQDCQGLALRQETAAVKFTVYYWEEGTNRADAFFVRYTTDGSTPLQSGGTASTIRKTIAASGLCVCACNLGASFADSAVIKVKVWMERNDGTAGSPDYKYSDNACSDNLTVDRTAATAALDIQSTQGTNPEG